MTRRLLRATLSLAACLSPMAACHAQATNADTAPRGPFNIVVKNDKLTLAVAKATQVYISGTIDANAPKRFEDMLRTGKIPSDSDIYLDASGDDVTAGYALGKLFRDSAMTTHLGALKLPGEPPRSATCSNACLFAFMGGLYRWSPSGADRLGVRQSFVGGLWPRGPQKTQTPADMVDYLKRMDINFWSLVRSPVPQPNDMVWLDADQTNGWGVANNGRLPLHADYPTEAIPPTLTLSQVTRAGMNRMTVVCTPTGATLTAYYTVGAERAKQLVARQQRALFEINQLEILPMQSGRARVTGDAIVISRPLSFEQLNAFLNTFSTGAWIKDKNGAVRYGFTMGPARVKDSYTTYFANCQKSAPRAASPAQ